MPRKKQSVESVEPVGDQSAEDPNALRIAPTRGFPKAPAEDVDIPVVDGVRYVTQDPNFDPDVDNAEDFAAEELPEGEEPK